MPLTHEVIDKAQALVCVASGRTAGTEMVAVIKATWTGVYALGSVVYVFRDYGGVADRHISTQCFRERGEMRKVRMTA